MEEWKKEESLPSTYNHDVVTTIDFKIPNPIDLVMHTLYLHKLMLYFNFDFLQFTVVMYAKVKPTSFIYKYKYIIFLHHIWKDSTIIYI